MLKKQSIKGKHKQAHHAIVRWKLWKAAWHTYSLICPDNDFTINLAPDPLFTAPWDNYLIPFPSQGSLRKAQIELKTPLFRTTFARSSILIIHFSPIWLCWAALSMCCFFNFGLENNCCVSPFNVNSLLIFRSCIGLMAWTKSFRPWQIYCVFS